MAKLSLDELRKLRENKKAEVQKRETEGKEVEIIIGMGTCGIAAGAKNTLDAFLAEIDTEKLDNIIIKQTGCMGYCQNEPTVEVKVPGMPDTIYNMVDKEVAKKIIEKHVIKKELVSEHVFDKPSVDIIDK